jgi:hypothetical protein
VQRVAGVDDIKLRTADDQALSCGIGVVHLDGLDVKALYEHLYEKEHISTWPIKAPEQPASDLALPVHEQARDRKARQDPARDPTPRSARMIAGAAAGMLSHRELRRLSRVGISQRSTRLSSGAYEGSTGVLR